MGRTILSQEHETGVDHSALYKRGFLQRNRSEIPKLGSQRLVCDYVKHQQRTDLLASSPNSSRVSGDFPLAESLMKMENKDESTPIQLNACRAIRERRISVQVNNTLEKLMRRSEDKGIIEIDLDESTMPQRMKLLETKLRHKKLQYSQILNKIVDIDSVVNYEFLLSEGASSVDKQLHDRLIKQVYGYIDERSQSMKSLSLLVNNERNTIGETGVDPQKKLKLSTGSLFRRQEEWLKKRDQRRSDALRRHENEILSVITGKPMIYSTNKSWIKAKKAHEKTLKRFIEEEKRKTGEKKEKEEIATESRQKEINDLLGKVREKRKKLKNDVTAKEQMKWLQNLSQPRQKGANKVKQFQQSMSDTIPCGILFERRLPGKSDSGLVVCKSFNDHLKSAKASTNDRPPNFYKSFSNMNDQDFKKYVRRISESAREKWIESCSKHQMT